MGSKRDRNIQANLRRGREELVIARQKVAATEGRIADAREEARRVTERAQRDISLAMGRMKDHLGRLKDILNRLYLMQVLSESQHKEALSWLDNDAYHIPMGNNTEESLFTMFTQQHYTELAKIIKQTRKEVLDGTIPMHVDHEDFLAVQEFTINEFQSRLMKMLAKDNPKFKELLFIAAASEHDK